MSAREESGDSYVAVNLRSGRAELKQDQELITQTHWTGALVTLELLDAVTSETLFRVESKNTKAFPIQTKYVEQIAAAVRMAADQLRQAIPAATESPGE
jgi:hypothetical protein